jgi:predicted permease
MFRRRSHKDFQHEIESHIEFEAERLKAEGVSEQEARAAALRRFGNVTAAIERYYESRRPVFLDRLLADCGFAVRNMAKHPVVSIVAILSLAAGIGCAAATLTIRNAIFYNPPPLYSTPAELSFLRTVTLDQARPQGVPAEIYLEWKGRSELAVGIAAAVPPRVTDIRSSDGSDEALVGAVSRSLFSVLGVAPFLGRVFSGTGEGEAVIAHRTWQIVLHGRADVIGSQVWIDNRAFTVVGVMPAQFWFVRMDRAPAAWISLDKIPVRRNETLDVIVRRAPGVSSSTLEQVLQTSVDRYFGSLPEGERNVRGIIEGVEGTPLGRAIAPPVVWLFGACVMLTLLISCTTVAILMIAEWTAREREIAIRASLGASRARVVRLLLTESTLLALVGGGLGVAATFVIRGLILHENALDNRPFYDLSLDPWILINTALIAVAAGILVGLAPALYETRELQTNPLRAMHSDRIRQRWRHVLVVVEITVTIALLVVTSTMVDAYRRNLSMNMGFDVSALVQAQIEAPDGNSTQDIIDRLSASPSVAAVAAASVLPLMGRGELHRVASENGGPSLPADRIFVGQGFFSTLGVAIRQGREYSRVESPNVVIVNETLANLIWPGRSPIGMRLWNDGKSYEVVGLAGNYISSMLGRPLPSFYLPLSATTDSGRILLVVRSKGDPAGVVQTVREQVRATSPVHVPTVVTTVRGILNQIGEEIMTVVYPMAVLIAVGTLMTATGIYSILAFAVTRRSKELAVRIAVGATNRDVLRAVSIHSARLIALGIVCGVGMTFGLSRLAQGKGGVFDSPSPGVFVVPVLIIVVVGTLAAWMPSRRALAVNPSVLLRSE